MISIGAILLIIGVALAVWQWDCVWMVLRGAAPLLFLAAGLLTFLIGYSQLKAKRFCKKHFKESTAEDNSA
jgi:hypothetical protein